MICIICHDKYPAKHSVDFSASAFIDHLLLQHPEWFKEPKKKVAKQKKAENTKKIVLSKEVYKKLTLEINRHHNL